MVRELKSGIQLLTLSETWLKQETSEGEHDIPGYRLYYFRKIIKIIEMEIMVELWCTHVNICLLQGERT